MAVCMLSTKDNPYDPFTQFDEWRAFDEENGYYSCEYLARIARTGNDLSEAEYEEEIENAIDEICAMNLTGNYVKITAPTLEQSS